MDSKVFLPLFIILLSLSTTVNAQNVNGRWSGTIHEGNVDFPLLIILHSSHEHELSGTIITPLGLRTLKNCQINRDSLFFVSQFGSNIIYNYAKAYPDSITMKMKGLLGKNKLYYFTLVRKNKPDKVSLAADSTYLSKKLHN